MPLPDTSFSLSAATLTLDSEHIVHVTWTAHRFKSEEFRAVLEQVFLLLLKSNSGRVLADQRLMRPIPPEEQEWLLHDWLPRAVRDGGYRYAAVLPSQEVFARLASTNVSMRVSGTYPLYRWFDDEATALAWLRQQ